MGICIPSPKIESPAEKAAQDVEVTLKRISKHGSSRSSRPLGHVVTGPFKGLLGVGCLQGDRGGEGKQDKPSSPLLLL